MNLVHALNHELRLALRRLNRAPGFALSVVVVLAISMVGTISVYSASYQLFFRPLDIVNHEHIAHISTFSGRLGLDVGFSPPMLVEFSQDPLVNDIAAYYESTLERAESGHNWRRSRVTYNLPTFLGATPLIGRTFRASDSEAGSPPVAMLSKAAWERHFGSDPSIIDGKLTIANDEVRIVGVMADSLTIPSPDTELWQPLQYSREQLAPQSIGRFSGGHLLVELTANGTSEMLKNSLRTRYRNDTRIPRGMELEFRVEDIRYAWTRDQRQPLVIVGLATTLVLFAAIANVAGLWLSRLLDQSCEKAIQTVIGQPAWRAQLATALDYALLGLASMTIAIALTPTSFRWLEHLGIISSDQPLGVSTTGHAVVIGLIVFVASSLPIIGVAAWQDKRRRRNLLREINGASRGALQSGNRFQGGLVAVQIALSVTLLCTMGILARSWYELLSEDLGFGADNLVVVSLDLRRSRRTGDIPRVVDELGRLPGIQSVSRASIVPFGNSESTSRVSISGVIEDRLTVREIHVGADFFRSLGIPLTSGRRFESTDNESSAIVDDFLSSTAIPNGTPLGRTIQLRTQNGGRLDTTIVGTVGTAKFRKLNERTEIGTVYIYAPKPSAKVNLIVRTEGSPASLVRVVRENVEASLGYEGVRDVSTMRDLLNRTVEDREPQIVLLAVFGIQILALAGVGLFALLAYTIRARRAEFGLRQAVGATTTDIKLLVVSSVFRLTVVGLFFGAIGAWASGALLAGWLYNVSAVDIFTWLCVFAAVSSVVLSAALWQASLAAGVQPSVALSDQ